jgi:hypothetical protein
MASFHSKTFQKHDDYMTPKSAWEAIVAFLPPGAKIWEAFYGDGKSGVYLKELGFNVIHENIDFFTSNEGDIVVSNPPFSLKKETLQRLVALEKPFMLLMPSSTMNTQYTRELFKNGGLQIIIPRKRIQFVKIKNGVEIPTNSCNFDCFYYCWKMNLPRDIIWLE